MKSPTRFRTALTSALIALTLLLPATGRASVSDIFKGWGWNSVNTGWISLNATNTSGSVDYGVTIDAGKNVFGWAWSSGLGWICFGSTCSGNPPGAPATGWALFDDTVNPPQLRGWARIQSLPGDQGWISLNCSNLASCGGSNYYVWASLSDGKFHGWGWNRTTVGGSYFGGVGWVRFDPIFGGGPLEEGAEGGAPWLQVLYGDLYTKGNISTPSPFTGIFQQANVTYCLDKGATSTISNFQQGSCPFPLSTNLNIPTGETGYATSLGRIDLTGMAAGRYGPRLVVSNLSTGVPSLLNGTIYETTGFGNYTLNGRTFNNATGSASGAGLIIVRGNLNITGNLLYQVSAITRLKQLASVGILVLDDGTGTRGNVTIDPSVGTISANIYAEGTVSTGSYPDQQTDPDVPLTINGVIVAKQIRFQRLFPGTVTEPSERVVYDGRIVANTPPGMNDFVRSLPTISN